MRAPTIDGVTVVHDGWGRLLLAEVTLVDGSRATREIEDHGDAAAVLAYDPGRRTAILVRQFRPPMLFAAGETENLEAVAGLLDGDEPDACARREAWEEAGLALVALEHIVTIWSTPGVSTERIHLFTASYSEANRTGPGGGAEDENEQITVVEMPLRELAEMADRGQLTDAKTLILLQTLRLRRPDLFGG